MSGAVVVEAHHLALSQSAPVVNTGVIRFIDNSDGTAVNGGRNYAEVSLEAGREYKGGFLSDEPSDAALQLFVHMCAAVKQPGARHRSAIFEHRSGSGV